MRWRCPPENSGGRRRAASAGSPTAASSSGSALAIVAAVDAERLRDHLMDRHPRIERRIRILEHHLQLAALRPQPRRPHRGDVIVLDQDRAAARIDQTQDQPPQRGFATAGFADQSERPSGGHEERHVAHRAQGVAPPTVVAADVKILSKRNHLKRATPRGRSGHFEDRGRGRWRRDRTRPLHRLFGEVTGDPVVGRDLTKRGNLFAAGGPPVRQTTAWMKCAAGRPFRQVRDLSRDRIQYRIVAIDPRQAGDQPDGVRMARLSECGLDTGTLHHSPAIHHGNPVRGFRDQTEVVRDQHHRRAGAGADAGQHIQHLGLDGHVQRRGWLVGNQHIRIVRHGDCDHGALAHAAGKFIRVPLKLAIRIGNSNKAQQFESAVANLRLRHRRVVQTNRLGNLHANSQHRIERRHRVLKDHRHRLAADLAHLLERETGEAAAAKDHFARRHSHRMRQQTHHGEHGQALARAGFADDAKHLVRKHVE